MPTPPNKVCVLIADPPWCFKVRSAKGSKKSPKYDTMSFDELAALGPTVRGLAGKHAYLAMWSTAPHLAQAMALLSAWGFEYKTWRAWQKNRLGTGYHCRSNAEILLIATRGSPGVPGGAKRRTLFSGEPLANKHSSKPDEVHDWLEAGFPCAKRIELFARRWRDGWWCIGGDLGTLLTPNGIVQRANYTEVVAHGQRSLQAEVGEPCH